MSPNHAVRRLFGWGLLLAATACGSASTGPNAVEGDFALQSLNESALPYDHEGLGCCTYLGGQLKLEQGRYVMSITARNRNTSLVFTATEWGKYTRQLSALSFVPDSFAVAPLGLDVGVLESGGVRIAFGGEGHGSPDQFHAFFVLLD